MGQREAIRGVLISLILGSHALLEGVPGLGKTSMVQAFAGALGISHSRIQFTPDLMPADITGTVVLVDNPTHAPTLVFQRGPLFGGLILADEINRASPRTQSALLEAMQEGTVTIGNETHVLPRPFSVLATQNPVEMQGTYPAARGPARPVPAEAALRVPDGRGADGDRAAHGDRHAALRLPRAAPTSCCAWASSRGTCRRPRRCSTTRAASIVALQPAPASSQLVRDSVRLGPSPRGAQALMLAGSVTALLAGRHHLAYEDIRAVALPALRHRLILTFDAERNALSADDIVSAVLHEVPEDAS